MTAGERAVGVCEELARVVGRGVVSITVSSAIAAAIDAAVAEEREACAVVAEGMPPVWDVHAPDPQHRIAAAIRERGQQ